MKVRKFKMVLIGLAVAGVFSAIVMLLWNALIPGIFGLTTINFWQALGLLVLTKILFGGFGGRGMMHGRRMGIHGHGDNPMHAKWMKMTPEERKEFIEKRRKYMHGFHSGRTGFFGRDFDSNANGDPQHNE